MKSMRYLLALTVAGSALYAGPALSQTKLMFDVFFPRHHALFLGTLKPFQADVAKVTKGSVIIEFPGSRLSPSKKQWEAVAKGISDVAVQFVGWQRQRLLLPQIPGLPFIHKNAARSSLALWRTHEKFFAPANEYKGMKLLSHVVSSGNHIMNTRRKIAQMTDFKGLKIRTSAGDNKKIMILLGATAVISSGPQIFEFISKGVVDGAVGPMYMATTYKILRYTKFATRFPGTLGGTSFGIFMNQKKWDGLSDANKKAILGVTGEKMALRGGKQFDTISDNSEAAMKKAGIKFNVASPAFMDQIKKTLQPIRDSWLKKAAKRKVDGKAAIAFFVSHSLK